MKKKTKEGENMFLGINLKSLAGVNIQVVLKKGLTHIFLCPKIRSPNIDVGADDSICPE